MINQSSNCRYANIDINPNDAHNCPNCWGYSQWNGTYYPQTKDLDKGINSEVKSRNGFIRTFVKRFIG